jgi:transcriptional regulator with XRE-family HTH domain
MKHPFDVHVGARLKQYRRSAGLSRQELGARIGVAARQIERFEEGEGRIDGTLLRDVVKVAGVSPAYFFEGLADVLKGVA